MDRDDSAGAGAGPLIWASSRKAAGPARGGRGGSSSNTLRARSRPRSRSRPLKIAPMPPRAISPKIWYRAPFVQRDHPSKPCSLASGPRVLPSILRVRRNEAGRKVLRRMHISPTVRSSRSTCGYRGGPVRGVGQRLRAFGREGMLEQAISGTDLGAASGVQLSSVHTGHSIDSAIAIPPGADHLSISIKRSIPRISLCQLIRDSGVLNEGESSVESRGSRGGAGTGIRRSARPAQWQRPSSLV